MITQNTANTSNVPPSDPLRATQRGGPATSTSYSNSDSCNVRAIIIDKSINFNKRQGNNVAKTQREKYQISRNFRGRKLLRISLLHGNIGDTSKQVIHKRLLCEISFLPQKIFTNGKQGSCSHTCVPLAP